MKKILLFTLLILFTNILIAQVTEIDDLSDAKTINQSVFLGNHAGSLSNFGASNIGLGTYSLYRSSGSYNVAIGQRSMYSSTLGNLNTAVGHNSLYYNVSGSYNCAFGDVSLYRLTDGEKNVSLGALSGFLGNGSSNIFLGYKSGYNETGSNKLYIENSDANSDNALIYGEFDNDLLRVNGNLEVNHNNGGIEGNGLKINNTINNRFWRLYTTSGSSGDLRFYSSRHNNQLVVKFNGYSGAYWHVSDMRKKMDIKELHFSWNDFMKLNTLTYKFKVQKDNTRHIGLLAQEVKKIYPELVDYTKEDDVYMMNYEGFGIVAIKAIQELKTEVEAQNKNIEKLTKESELLLQKLSKFQEFEKRLKAIEENASYSVLK